MRPAFLGWCLFAPAALLTLVASSYVSTHEAVCLGADPDTGANHGGYEGSGGLLAFGASAVATLMCIGAVVAFAVAVRRADELRPAIGFVGAIAVGAAAVLVFFWAVLETTFVCGFF